MRIGHGYDAHRFQAGRALVLGGVKIPYPLGLAGHSDADVVIHALCDALLGAAALGDIGQYFPDSNPELAGINSRLLLQQVMELLANHNYRIGNVDITIVAQEPKLAPYREQMRLHLAEDLRVTREQVNIKATTTEGLGFTGRKEGISAYAVALLLNKDEVPTSTIL